MKFKVIALAALMGISGMAAQANELPDGPHIVTSGTASVDAVPDIATLAIEVNVPRRMPLQPRNRQMSASHNTFPSLNSIRSRKKISAQRIYAPSQIMIIRMVKVS